MLESRRAVLSVPYRAPAWLPGGHAQTLYGALLAAAGPVPLYARRRWETPDGDFVDVDRLGSNIAAPLVVLFHGLEGSSGSHYARALAGAVTDAGWRLAVPHFRGCSGEPNRLARAYHSGDSDEVGWMLTRFSIEAQGAGLVAVGVSLGANALLKWLGEARQDAQPVLRCAVAVSAPLDLTVAGPALDRGFNRLYAYNFLRTLKRKGMEKARRFPERIDLRSVQRLRTIRQFDDLVTAPLHGFRDAEEYWRRSSAKPWLRDIRVPTLLLNARNDPFLPGEALPGHAELADCVQSDFPEQGGHVGFVGGPFPGNFDWFGERVVSYIRGNIAAQPAHAGSTSPAGR